MLRRIFSIVMAYMAAVGPMPSVYAAGEEISVEASISATRISLKDAAQLTLTIHGAKGDNGPLQLPKIDGLDSAYVGPATRIAIVNGQYSSEHSFIYNLFPTKTGRFQIPALTISVGGKEYTTSPIDLQVETPAPASASDAGPGPLTEQNIKDRILINVSIPKATVYEGERIPLSIKLLVNGLPIRNIQYPQLEKSGFTMQDIPQPQQYSENVNGVKYDVVDFKTFIYPTRTGEVTIGPVRIEGSLLYKTVQQNNPGFFSDSFFNSFFDSYQQRPLTVTSEPLTFHVMPLPQEGQPVDFSGAVGQLEFGASIGPDKVKVGDPVTLRMKISGQGNFKSIELPAFADSNFKAYEPTVKDEANGKSLEQVIIPTSADTREVPLLRFSYFDPDIQEYKTLTQGPFALTVIPPAKGEEFKAVGFTDLSSTKVEQVDYIQKYIKQPLQKLLALAKTVEFWLVIIGLGLLWVLWLTWQGFRERLSTDRAFSRRLGALKNARSGLKQAKARMESGNPIEFYNVLTKTLDNYFADKFNQSAGALNWETISVLLQQKNAAAAHVQALQEIYRSSELIRFAGGKAGASQMLQDLTYAQSAIDNLEKHLK